MRLQKITTNLELLLTFFTIHKLYNFHWFPMCYITWGCQISFRFLDMWFFIVGPTKDGLLSLIYEISSVFISLKHPCCKGCTKSTEVFKKNVYFLPHSFVQIEKSRYPNSFFWPEEYIVVMTQHYNTSKTVHLNLAKWFRIPFSKDFVRWEQW